MKDELIKKYESLTFTNDFIFGKVMQDMELCREIVSRIVGFDVGELSDASIQVSIKETIDGRGIRIDSLADSNINYRYSSEMQVQEEKYAGKRIRYYQGNLDITSLQMAEGYDKLPDIYMIFICMHDIIGDGRYKHEFVYTSKENPEKVLDDGSHRIIINLKGNAGDITLELKELIDYMLHGICESEFTKRLHASVTRIKVSRKYREDYMRYTLEKQRIERESRAAGIEEGIERGTEQERKRNAIAMRDMLYGMSMARWEVEEKLRQSMSLDTEMLNEIMDFK